MTKDILDWCEKYLEPKNKHLGNVPVCPYARTARLQNKYRILEVHNWDSFIETIVEGVELAKSPDVQIVIVAMIFAWSLKNWLQLRTATTLFLCHKISI